MEEHGYDDAAELKEALDGGKSLQDLLGDRDAAELIGKADTLDKYETHWQKQEAQKLRDEEEPDDTIFRLEKELKALREADSTRKATTKAERDAQTAIDRFNSVVGGVVKNADLPTEYLKFAKEYLGVENPANEVDVSKKTEIKGHAKSGVEKLKEFEQAVIKNYLAGKDKITKVTETDTVTAPIDKEPENKKGLEGLRERFKQAMAKS